MKSINWKDALKIGVIVILFISLMNFFGGLFSGYELKQMLDTEIVIPNYGKVVTDAFRKDFLKALDTDFLAGYFLLAFIVLELIHFFIIRLDKIHKGAIIAVVAVCTALMVAALIISIYRISGSFDSVSMVTRSNVSSYPNSKNYYSYSYFQMYQSASLSMFVATLFISVIMIVTNVINFVNAIVYKRSAPQAVEYNEE
ncbi:MAG: hypothetical protein J6Y44_03230 [Clostridia bacterium]|nr:hypothetical protein [Clostridia bacterium]